MSDGDPLIRQAESWARIVPGLLVSDIDASVDVYTRLFGFELAHAESGRLAELRIEGAQLLLTQFVADASLVGAELTNPFGRGLTLHVRLADPKALYESLRAEKYPIVVPMELSELSEGGERFTRASFVVADPDGYLINFSD